MLNFCTQSLYLHLATTYKLSSESNASYSCRTIVLAISIELTTAIIFQTIFLDHSNRLSNMYTQWLELSATAHMPSLPNAMPNGLPMIPASLIILLTIIIVGTSFIFSYFSFPKFFPTYYAQYFPHHQLICSKV